jgi:hypothetical protein
MARRCLRVVGWSIAAAGLAGMLAAAATGKANAPPAAHIHAEFESAVNFAGSADCIPGPPSFPLLVEGRGVGTGTFGKFDARSARRRNEAQGKLLGRLCRRWTAVTT